MSDGLPHESDRGRRDRERVAAVGGERLVPSPDPIARDYLLLSLRLDHHIPGLVDAYFGPAALKAQVDLEQLPSPARLRDDAAALLSRVRDAGSGEIPDPARRRWLEAQILALETQARELAGDPLPYREHVTRCFDLRPERTPERVFEDAARDLDALLPPAPHGARSRLPGALPRGTPGSRFARRRSSPF